MIVHRADVASRADWDTSDAHASRGSMAPQGEVAQVHVDPADIGERPNDAASPSAQENQASERAVSHAAQTVAQLEALVARNPDLAGELEDGLMAAKAKLDRAMVDSVTSGLDASAMHCADYPDYQACVLQIGAQLAARLVRDPVALSALARALHAVRAPDHLHERLDIARVDLSAYAILQSARGQPVDAGVVAGKETEIARLEVLVAGAQAARQHDTGTTIDTHRDRLGIDPIDASQRPVNNKEPT